jgi:BASS family bile acid:Na+ symporter
MVHVDLKEIVILALKVSIFCIVFGFGLKATLEDLLYVVRRPGLLARSLLAVFVIMPLVAVMLARLFDFTQTVRIVLVALAVSPLPPILPKKESKAGGYTPFGLGLMAVLALISIVAVPASVELLGRFVGRQLEPAAGTIARAVLMSTLVPLAAGMIVRAALPAFADRLENIVTLLGKVLLPLGVLALVVGALPAMWALIGNGNVLAIVIFAVAGLAIGHVLGGPNPDHSLVLALSTACRHPAIALSLAAANFPDQRFGATILLYLIVSGLVGIPYLAWQERQAAGTVPAS